MDELTEAYEEKLRELRTRVQAGQGETGAVETMLGEKEKEVERLRGLLALAEKQNEESWERYQVELRELGQ